MQFTPVRRRRFLVAKCCAVCSFSVLVGCEEIIDARFDDAELARMEAGAPVPDGSPPLTEAAACDLLHPPERGQIPPAPGATEFTVVISSIDYGDRATSIPPEYLSVGYDLDNRCTAAGETSCRPHNWIEADHTDGARGEDNATGHLLYTEAAVFGVQIVSSEAMNSGLVAGADAPTGLLRVRGYGGLALDDHVEVDWYVASLPSPADGGFVAPALEESDQWTVLSSSVADPTATDAANTNSIYRDANAFVTRGSLVAHFARTMIPLADVYFEVNDVTLTATVVRDAATEQWLLMDGILSGWAETNSLLQVVANVGYSISGVMLCTDNTANYPAVKAFICSSSDLSANPDDVNAPCTRTSVGARFSARPATLGVLAEPVQTASLCPPETDPALDDCAEPPVTP